MASLGTWEYETCKSWLRMSWSLDLTMMHDKRLDSVSRMQKESITEVSLLPVVVRGLMSHLVLYIVMYAVR